MGRGKVHVHTDTFSTVILSNIRSNIRAQCCRKSPKYVCEQLLSLCTTIIMLHAWKFGSIHTHKHTHTHTHTHTKSKVFRCRLAVTLSGIARMPVH